MLRAALFLSLLPLLLASPGTAQDPAAPPDREAFSFVIFGDRTGGHPDGIKVLDRAVDAANRLDPDFVMTVGDLVQGYNEGDEWVQQMREYKRVMNRLARPWYPVAGNHDVYGGRGNKGGNVELFKKHFGPLWYSFNYKWGHFVVLFSDEHLSFANPAKDQNVGPEQMAWLKKDLAEAKAEQVYVFLHHPRWLYKGTNWPQVHKLLSADGRVRAVYAGHIHTYRDDGVKDGVHYYTCAVTGGHAGGAKTPVALHHMNHVRVTRKGPVMSVLPVGSVLGADMVHGEEVDRLAAMRDGSWLHVEDRVACAPDAAHDSKLTVRVVNPAKTPVAYELRLELPPGWSGTPALVGGQLGVGKDVTQTFAIQAAAFSGKLQKPLIRAVLHHPLKSGLVHPVHHVRPIGVRITGLPSAAAKRNKVLVLDGSSAIRVDTGAFTAPAFTLECWVRGEDRKGVSALVAKTERSGFGLWWNGGDRKLPYAIVGSEHLRRYVYAEAKEPWAWNEWTHVAMCSGDGWLRVFVGGKLAAEEKLEGVRSANSLPLYIGADPDRRGRPSRFFKGRIDEVRLSMNVRYKRGFTPARHFGRDTHTALLYHFDQEFKGLHPDDSGKDVHGSSLGSPRLVEEQR